MSRRAIRKTRIIPLSRSEIPQYNPDNPKGQTRTIRIFRKVKSGKFRIFRALFPEIPDYPDMPGLCPSALSGISGPSFDKGARGEPLGRPNGPKVGGASLFAFPRCYPPKAEGQGPLSGLEPLPGGERLPSLFTFERGVSCNTPLHDYRGNIK